MHMYMSNRLRSSFEIADCMIERDKDRELLGFVAHLEHLIMCKEEKEQTTTPISLGVVCCRVYSSTI